jgi:hypothetical protein
MTLLCNARTTNAGRYQQFIELSAKFTKLKFVETLKLWKMQQCIQTLYLNKPDIHYRYITYDIETLYLLVY